MTNKLLLLIEKNIKYDLRSWKCLLLELLIIIAAFLAISLYHPAVTLNSNLDPNELKRTKLNENDAEINDLKLFRQIMNIPPQSYRLLYTPIHETTRVIMNAVSEMLALDGAEGVDDDFDRLLQKFNKNESLAAVIFHKFTHDVLSITIRFPSQFRTLRKGTECWERACFWSTRFSGSLERNDFEEYSKYTDLYIREGFLQIQHAIFRAWIQFYDSSKYQELPSLGINSFLHDTDQEMHFLSGTINCTWIFYYFLYFVPFLNLVWKIAREVEENIAAQHRIYGLSYNQHWIAHLIASFVHFIVLDVLIFSLLMIEWPYGAISNCKRTGYLFLFLILYSGMLILNAFIMAKLMGNAKSAVFLAAALWWAAYGIFSSNLANATNIGPQVLLWLLMFFNNFFPFGMRYLEEHSEEKIPKQIWFLLLIQTCSLLLYWGCLQCLDCLRPGRYVKTSNDGRSCCRCNKKDEKVIKSENDSTFYAICDDLNWSTFEYGPVGGHLLILQNLYVYRDSLKRESLLKNISMRLFKDEISVVLGSHSSGKTSLISVLAGWHKYYGHIYFEDNREISENFSYYCRHIDVSLPNNPLYDLLTVEEQLQYVILNKQYESVPSKLQLKMELDKWLMVLKTSVADSSKLVKSLNFDQRRLVALCGTLSGNSRIILLDEPTLHMRAEERRVYWRILRQEKLNRVVVMTTNSIDEANEIADRIAILNRGSLVAWATPFYLKTNLSKGVYLVLFVLPLTHIKPITQLLEKYIPTVTVHSHFNDRVIYILPNHKRPSFQKIIIDLEKESTDLGISNMYVTGFELNDVYMNLTTRSDIRKQLPNMEKTLNFLNDPTPQHREVPMSYALLYKKLLYQAPNVTPVFIMFLAILLILMIYEMSKHVAPHDRIQMGFSPHKNTNELSVGLDKCKYLEINRIGEMRRSKSNWRPHEWFVDKLKCGYAPYKEDILKDSTIYDKLGAVERDLGKSQLNLWINEKIFHSAALSLNLAHNVILKDLYPNNTHKMVNINNEPIWEPVSEKIALNQFENLFVPLTLGIIMPLMVSVFILTPIDERRNHMETLQRISGATITTYWLTNFMWDYAVYVVLTLLYFLVMCAYTMEEFLGIPKLGTLLLLSVYGIASLMLVYLVFLFASDHKLRGVLKVFLLQMIVGYCPFILYWDVADTDPYWFYVMMFSPTFALLVGMGNIQAENMARVFCQNRCDGIAGCNEENGCSFVPQCCSKSFLQWSFPGILPSLLFMSLTGVILTIVFIAMTVYRSNRKYSPPNRLTEMTSVFYPYDDELVIAERVRISNMNIATCKTHAVLVDQLEYEIPKRGNRVKAMSFALNRYGCMGIYGSGHSGKTHLIKQLIGEEGFRFGEVYICGREIKRGIRNLGYCPQDNGFCEGSTPRQIFTLFFMLSGISESNCYKNISDLSLTFKLRNFMNTRISELPDHIRRRVNIAIALIFHNKVLIFDEPTKGLAGQERQLMWHVMRLARANGNTIIFTSQDTLELEQLADFIIVVDNGEMLAIGSPQIIRQIYTMGFYLEIKLTSDGETLEALENNLRKDIENLQRFIVFLHAESELLNRHGNVLKYYLPIENATYSYLFGTMEKNRQRLNIAEYMICQGSLSTALDNLQKARKEKVRYEKSKTTGVRAPAAIVGS